MMLKGQEIDQAGVPESFRVLMKEFQALGLDISIINDKGENLQLKEIETEEDKDESKSSSEDMDSPKIEEIVNGESSSEEEVLEEGADI